MGSKAPGGPSSSRARARRAMLKRIGDRVRAIRDGRGMPGRELATRLGLPFHELDALIEEAAGLTLAEIFELHGEAYYRRLERETLAAFLASTPAAVLATGGSLVNDRETYRLLRRRALTVW